ncbi:MAG: ATP-grasp domain-containing protein [Gemmataceae bacterium]|nr:ATP-grasp domain-containing protein [Gemmataceae bacterium]
MGASTRAAAASALRAGFTPWCADLFADADLRQACPVHRVPPGDYPRGLRSAVEAAPAGPWLYTGALENYPDIIATIDRALWGNSPQVLRRVRSPRLVHECLTRQGLPCPGLASGDPDPRRRWLVKPIRSAGGHGIRFWKPGESIDRRRFYLQEWIEGQSCAAIFAAQPGRATPLLGVATQLVGETWLGAAPFHYCGSLGPVALPNEVRAVLTRIGGVLAGAFGLRGLFGVDCVWRDGVPWPIEINPRYTASIEVLERATGHAFLAAHATAFTGAASDVSSPVGMARCVAKGILFAQTALTFPERGPWDVALRTPLADPATPFADIPAPGTCIEAGQPICTAFAGGDGAEACLSALRDSVRTLELTLYGV